MNASTESGTPTRTQMSHYPPPRPRGLRRPDTLRSRASTLIHRIAPAESDLQRYFNVSAPSVHQMILTLEARGFLERVPGKPRSIRLLLSRDDLPRLE